MESITTNDRNRLHATVIGVVRWMSLLLCVLCHCRHNASAATPEEIRASWQTYADKIKSLRCECDVERLEQLDEDMIPGGALQSDKEKPLLIPLKTDESGNSLMSSKVKFNFWMEGDKLALRRSVDRSIGANIPHAFETEERSFDGRENSFLMSSPDISMGGVKADKQPAQELTKNMELIPLWLAISPSRLLEECGAHKSDPFQLADAHSWHDGVECIDLTRQLPGPPGSKSTAILSVDPSRDYRPIHLSIRTMEITVAYSPNSGIGWVPSEYQLKVAYPDASQADDNVTAKVTQFAINDAIEESVFTIKFAPGAHIEKNGQYFLLEQDGSLRPITALEFGTPNPQPKTQ